MVVARIRSEALVASLVLLCSLAVSAPPSTARADEPAPAGTTDAGTAGAVAELLGDGGVPEPEVDAEEPTMALVEGATAQVESLTIVQVGTYLLRISDFSQRDGRFEVDMWMWFRWQGTDVMPHESFEIVNGSIHEREANDVIDDGGFNYAAVRVQATVFHQFDVRHFPFDDHVLTIEIEDSNLENTNLQFVADEGIDIDRSVSVEGWRLSLGRPHAGPHVYPTTYGYRSLDSSTSSYSRFVVPLVLERRNFTALFKLFWVSYLSVVLGLLAFRVRATDLDARFGLGTGSIFAASANAFVVSEQLPQTAAITLAEQVNLLAVGCIFVSVFISVASLRLCYQGKDEASEKLDKRALLGLIVFYVCANVLAIGYALH